MNNTIILPAQCNITINKNKELIELELNTLNEGKNSIEVPSKEILQHLLTL